ncbi:cupredoxin domain-containing protein [Halegenticoccus tardaugens]|uniref:cupredoxin domain-containing protein n=1 Tax=Halegenticoccus tardaugens TaxID=2071624 RepID=UPI00100AE6AE|nr:plastocyanin/azurin family copper-binding protein [Halegenticoccus tardaugens]
MNRRTFLASAGLAGVAGLAGCAALQFGGNRDFDVGMTAETFDPAELTVSVGDEVVWMNTSSRAHTVTAYENAIPEEAEYFASGGFDSERAAREAWRQGGGALDNGETFSHTFDAPGRYEYVCVPHEMAGMVGTVVVEEG